MWSVEVENSMRLHDFLTKWINKKVWNINKTFTLFPATSHIHYKGFEGQKFFQLWLNQIYIIKQVFLKNWFFKACAPFYAAVCIRKGVFKLLTYFLLSFEFLKTVFKIIIKQIFNKSKNKIPKILKFSPKKAVFLLSPKKTVDVDTV